MMYTYKRRLRFPLVKRRKAKSPGEPFFIKAALYIGICVMLVLSFSFTNNAGRGAYMQDEIAYATDGELEDAPDIDAAFENSVIDPKLILAQEMPVIYGVKVEHASRIGESEHDLYFDVLPEDLKLEILRFTNEPKAFYVGAQSPQILIYHTHTLEAYRQITGEEYVEAGRWRTKDERNSVIAVGETLKKALEEYGYGVVHDKTEHESPSLKTAYTRSNKTIQKYSEQYPAISVYIDVHRDASTNEKDYVKIDGKQCAKVMFVVGPNKKPEEKPKFESNYKLALAVTNELEEIKKGFTRPICVQNSSKHYNQQSSDMCLLIEVGHNSNTLEQALNTAEYVAQALSRVLKISGP